MLDKLLIGRRDSIHSILFLVECDNHLLLQNFVAHKTQGAHEHCAGVVSELNARHQRDIISNSQRVFRYLFVRKPTTHKNCLLHIQRSG